LKILTFNLGHRRSTAREIVRALGESEADVVALQEVGPHHAVAIGMELARAYPHQVMDGLGIDGMGLLSRYPIVEHEFFTLSSPRAHLRVRLDADGRALEVLDVHAMVWVGFFGRVAPGAGDLTELAARALASSPAVLVGDLNTWPGSGVYRILERAGLRDAFADVSEAPGFTFPVFGRYRGLPLPPFLRLDYVWTTPDLCCVRAEVGRTAGSDHLPVLAELAWADARDDEAGA